MGPIPEHLVLPIIDARVTRPGRNELARPCPKGHRGGMHPVAYDDGQPGEQVDQRSVRRREVLILLRCHSPGWGAPLAGGWVHRCLQVVDLPPPGGAVVTEHELLARRGPRCRRRLLPAAPGLAAGRIGRSCFGPCLTAAVTVMRSIERLPQRLIRARLARDYGLALSEGGLVGLLRLAAEQAKPRYQALAAAVRRSAVVHADETTWREDGLPSSIRVPCGRFSTPAICSFHRDPSRSGTVPDAILGAGFSGILISDCYAAYDHFPGRHQRCWSHLWRDIAALERQFPDDQTLAAWITGIGTIWKAATGPRPDQEAGDTKAARRARATRAHRYEQQLLALCPGDLAPERPEAPLAARLRRYLDDLRGPSGCFVRDSTVPPTNNAAERSLRPLVIARNISGGTRSPSGSQATMILASVLGTAQLTGEDPMTTMLHLFLPAAQSP